MRLDIRNMDRKYCAQFDVTLNGVKQTQCIVADSDKGYVIRYKTNRFGLHEMRNGKTIHERVEGLVTIMNRETSKLKTEMPEVQQEIVAHIQSKESEHRDEVRIGVDFNRRGKSVMQSMTVAALIASGTKGLQLKPLNEMTVEPGPKPDAVWFDETSRLVKRDDHAD